MFKNPPVIALFSLSVACGAPVAPHVDSADTKVEARVAELLVSGLEDAVSTGDIELENFIDDNNAEGQFTFQDDAWLGHIEGPVDISWTQTGVDWEIEAYLDGFGRDSEDFTGELSIEVTEQNGGDETVVTFDGVLDSSLSGEVEVEIEVTVDRHEGLRGVVYGGTVDERWVQGQFDRKEDEPDEEQGCKAPIGVDCE